VRNCVRGGVVTADVGDRETMFGVGSWWPTLLLRGGRQHCITSGHRQWMVWSQVVVVGGSGWENLRETEMGAEVWDLVDDLSKRAFVFYCS
jgi:hypothetical protein